MVPAPPPPAPPGAKSEAGTASGEAGETPSASASPPSPSPLPSPESAQSSAPGAQQSKSAEPGAGGGVNGESQKGSGGVPQETPAAKSSEPAPGPAEPDPLRGPGVRLESYEEFAARSRSHHPTQGVGKGFIAGESEEERKERMRRLAEKARETQEAKKRAEASKQPPITTEVLPRAEPGSEFKGGGKKAEPPPLRTTKISADAAEKLCKAGTIALDTVFYHGVAQAPRVRPLPPDKREEIAKLAILDDAERKAVVAACVPILTDYEIPPWLQAVIVVGMIYGAKSVAVAAAINAAENPNPGGNNATQ